MECVQLANSELVELPSLDCSHVTDSVQDEKVISQLLSTALCHAVYLYMTDHGDLLAYRLCRSVAQRSICISTASN